MATAVNPIESWVRIIERQAREIGVTLVVHGVLITGIMTPFRRYGRWATEVFQRALLSGGSFEVPSGEMHELTATEADRLRAEWKELEDEERKSEGLAPDEEVELDMDLSYFCLRNANIHAGVVPTSWFTLPYVLIRTASVDAFTPGKVSIEPVGSSSGSMG
jgi:hypothetical protein